MSCDATSFCFSPSALELIKTAIEKAGFTDKVVIGMDVAASEFFIEGKYDLDFKSPPSAARNISGEELAGIYQGFINNYPGVYSDVCVSQMGPTHVSYSCCPEVDKSSWNKGNVFPQVTERPGAGLNVS